MPFGCKGESRVSGGSCALRHSTMLIMLSMFPSPDSVVAPGGRIRLLQEMYFISFCSFCRSSDKRLESNSAKIEERKKKKK